MPGISSKPASTVAFRRNAAPPVPPRPEKPDNSYETPMGVDRARGAARQRGPQRLKSIWTRPPAQTVAPTPPATAQPPDAAHVGERVDLTDIAASTSPAMPHERDEASGATGGVASERVAQGAKDVARGVKDTSRAPEADTAYEKLKP